MIFCLYSVLKQMLIDEPEECETINSFIIPILQELDWPIKYCGDGVCLRRRSSSNFDLVFMYKNTPLLAIECKRFSRDILQDSSNNDADSPSNHRLSEQVILYYKKIITLGGQCDYCPPIIWTNGAYWIVFKDAALNDRLSGRLSEEELYEKFKELKTVDVNSWFKKISFLCGDPSEFSLRLNALAQEISFEKVFGAYVLKCATTTRNDSYKEVKP